MVVPMNGPEAYHYSGATYAQPMQFAYDGREPAAYPVPYDEQCPPVEQPGTIDIDLDAPGISLSGIAQYMRELRQTTRLPPATEQQLVEQARQGDQAAKHRLIEDRLPYIMHMATRYHVYAEYEDLLDIVSTANLAVTANIDKALGKENPAAYLCGVAKREIRTYCFYHSRLMPIKDHRMPLAEAPTVVSLNEQCAEQYRYQGSQSQDGTSETGSTRWEQFRQVIDALPD